MRLYSDIEIVDGMPASMSKEMRECVERHLDQIRETIRKEKEELRRQAEVIDNISDEELNAQANEAFGGLTEDEFYMYGTPNTEYMEDGEPVQKMSSDELSDILTKQKYGENKVELPRPEPVNPPTYIPATDQFIDSVLTKLGKQDMKGELYQQLQQQSLNSSGCNNQIYQQPPLNNNNYNYYNNQQPMMNNNIMNTNCGYNNMYQQPIYNQPQQYNYYNNGGNNYSNIYGGNVSNNYTNQYSGYTSNPNYTFNPYSMYGTNNNYYGYGYGSKPWLNTQVTIPEVYPHSANNPGIFGETNPYVYYGIPYQYGYNNEYVEDMIKELEQQRQYRCNTDVYLVKRQNKCRFYDSSGNFDQEEYNNFCKEVEEWYGFTSLKDLAEKRKEYEKEQIERVYKEAEENGKIDLLHGDQDYTGYDLNGVRRYRTTLCFNVRDINDPSKIIRTYGPDDPETGYRIVERTWQQDMASRNLYEDWCRVDYENYCRDEQIRRQARAMREKWDRLYAGKTMDEQIAAYYEETEIKPMMEKIRMDQMRSLWDKNRYRSMFASNGINTDIKFSNMSTAFNYNYDMAVDLKKAQQQYSIDELNNNKQLISVLNQNYDWKKEKFMGNIRKGDCTSDVSFLQNNGTPIVYHKPLNEVKLGENETITFENSDRYLPGSNIPVRKTTITHGTLSDEEAQRIMNEPGGIVYEEVVNM